MLRVDDFVDIKKNLVSALRYLYPTDKVQIVNIIYRDFDLGKMDTQLHRDSVISSCQQLVKVTQKSEYLLIIDNCDKITPRGIKALSN